ncbi:helicase protein [Dictyocaulus viviparus]|uniref:Helicase protein n=1 Tax=Dictyocaulus viviparus TaxID=29172 RepID=A0A0D8XFM2_DICVI|nr:helicase protein [Dictyocaulus viviparus]
MGAQSSPSHEWTAAVCTTEKANSLLNHAIMDGRMEEIDVQVAAFMGAQSSPSHEWTAAVCTTEKANSLINHAIMDGRMEEIDVQVAAFMGAQSSPSHEWTAAVCTTEKANSLLNHAIMDGRMEEIGLIVIDELHMVYDSSRGATLESLCTKINIWNRRKPSAAIRIIGMSATLNNLTEVGAWLCAKVIETKFRPVELHERICCDGNITDLKTGTVVRKISKKFRVSDDPECVIGLAAEGIFLRKLVLVFCSSKNDVEKVAVDLAKVLDGIYRSNHVIAARVNRTALRKVQENLRRLVGTLDKVLAQTLPRAVAFHHAGLTIEERECIEDNFRSGVIMILVATSTLSSGVNLPAGRVVIKAQIRGPAALTATSYKQMCGRSGRLGEVEQGSFLYTL